MLFVTNDRSNLYCFVMCSCRAVYGPFSGLRKDHVTGKTYGLNDELNVFTNW